jgi:diguanylate cyclase (GGDEF)-like protein
VISLKKYLDMETGEIGKNKPAATDTGTIELLSAALECYRAALLAMGENAGQACPAVGAELQQSLASLEKRLSGKITSLMIKESERQAKEQLQQWAGRTAEYFKSKASEVKELLIVLARTAESVGKRDQRYEDQLNAFTTRLQAIANLDDLTKVRMSLVKGAAELKTCVDQMAKESRNVLEQLRAEIKNYETKLKAVEQLAARDALTGLASRRHVEEQIELRIQQKQVFCVVILDLNRLKQVNDTHGHLAGDDLLKQFSQELRSNSRPSDLVGRWGGDEFIVVLDCDLSGARSLMDRVLQWAFGQYTIQLGTGKGEIKVNVDASLGMAQWNPGETLRQVVERADAAMYKEKALAHKQSY